MNTAVRARGIMAAALIGAAAVLSSGCIAAIGGTDKNYPPTLGRQLMDLQSAHEKGAINDEEYAQAKGRLLAHSSAYRD